MLFVVCCFTCDQWGKNSLPQHPAVRLLSKLRKTIEKDNNFFSKKTCHQTARNKSFVAASFRNYRRVHYGTREKWA